jgi:prepilin-type N-terminal cleavage/methylation domain-containing protein
MYIIISNITNHSVLKGVGNVMNVPNKTKGFTIIEVVLVLAIAGLIFLVVFLALPALQRGQRDSQRKTDLSKLMSQVTAYQSNNQGALPYGNWTTFRSSYLTANSTPFADPSSGSDYTITQQTSTTGAGAPSAITAGNIWVYPGLNCNNGGPTGTPVTTSRNFAAIIHQEQGGYFCQAN